MFSIKACYVVVGCSIVFYKRSRKTQVGSLLTPSAPPAQPPSLKIWHGRRSRRHVWRGLWWVRLPRRVSRGTSCREIDWWRERRRPFSQAVAEVSCVCSHSTTRWLHISTPCCSKYAGIHKYPGKRLLWQERWPAHGRVGSAAATHSHVAVWQRKAWHGGASWR